jgi:hypothetical protein
MWEKLGLVYVATGEQPWAASHARMPATLMISDEIIRVFVGFLDRDKVGRVGFVDVDARDPRRVLAVSPHPVLDIGEPGTFDDNGAQPSSVLQHERKLYLFYTGWQLGVRVRYFMFDNVAVSSDRGKTFQKIAAVPLLERTSNELFVRAAPFVMPHNVGWRMWYIGGNRWIEVEGKQVPSYQVRYLESADLLNWKGEGTTCLEPAGDEYGFGRPFVIQKNGRLRMWYSIRSISKGYRLGYAESEDGLRWVRSDDRVGIDVSAAGWDSEMICFAVIQPTPHGTYMFYNGNNYGETGFGVAVLRSRDSS